MTPEARPAVQQPDFSSEEKRELPLAGKVVVVTGGTRGIGAEMSIALAKLGAIIVAPHRDIGKEGRAQSLVQKVIDEGGEMSAPVIDITKAKDRQRLFDFVKEKYGKVDILIHNAAGGLEQWATPEYANEINAVAKAELTKLFASLLEDKEGEKKIVVDVPSIWSMFYKRPGLKHKIKGYDIVAKSKRTGDKAVQDTLIDINAGRINKVMFARICGHAIPGTPTIDYYSRRYKKDMAAIQKTAIGGKLPTTVNMAEAAVKIATGDFENGYTEFVGIPVSDKEQTKKTLKAYNDNTRFVDWELFADNRNAYAFFTPLENHTTDPFTFERGAVLIENIVYPNENQTDGNLEITTFHTDGHFTEEIGVSLFPGHLQVAAADRVLKAAVEDKLPENKMARLRKIGQITFDQMVVPKDTLNIHTEITDLKDKSATGTAVMQVNGVRTSSVSDMIYEIVDRVDQAGEFSFNRFIEAAAQAAGVAYFHAKDLTEAMPLFTGVESAEFRRPILAGEELEMETRIKYDPKKTNGFSANVTIRVKDKIVAKVNGIACMIIPDIEQGKKLLAFQLRRRGRR